MYSTHIEDPSAPYSIPKVLLYEKSNLLKMNILDINVIGMFNYH